MMYINNGAVNLNVEWHRGDDREKETVILLHGGPGVPYAMTEVAVELEKKFSVLKFDQRGSGQSSCPNCNFSMESYISDINAIAENLKLKSFHLFGHSWGGLYAQVYADQYPDTVKSLFLCSPASGTGQTWLKTEKEMLAYNKKRATGKEWLKMGWYALWGMLGNNKAYQKLMKQVMINYNKDYLNMESYDPNLGMIYAKTINKTLKAIIRYKPLPRLENPPFPVLITYGDDDIYGKSKNEVFNRYPTAQTEIISGCGHLPWMHKPEEFKQILARFYEM